MPEFEVGGRYLLPPEQALRDGSTAALAVPLHDERPRAPRMDDHWLFVPLYGRTGNLPA